jgi:hypothetical protein
MQRWACTQSRHDKLADALNAPNAHDAQGPVARNVLIHQRMLLTATCSWQRARRGPCCLHYNHVFALHNSEPDNVDLDRRLAAAGSTHTLTII